MAWLGLGVPIFVTYKVCLFSISYEGCGGSKWVEVGWQDCGLQNLFAESNLGFTSAYITLISYNAQQPADASENINR